MAKKFDYRRVAMTAARILNRFGSPVQSVYKSREQAAAYNPATGTNQFGYLGKEFADEFPVDAVLMDFSQRDIDGSLIQVGDQRIFLPGTLPVTPKTGDVVSVPVYEGETVVGYDEYEVVTARAEAPGGIVVIHEVQGRKD